jgi:hypothetical protein
MATAVASLLLPGSALAAGPGAARPAPVFADGQPDDDTRLSVLTPAEAAFMDLKLAMAASLSTVASAPRAGSKSAVPMVACELDPCDAPPPPWPGPEGPTPSRTLGTKARQQINNYFCGPAAGQVVINWTRGITSGNNNGEDPTTNWRKQSKIAEWMGTTTAGTGGAGVASGLNHPNAVLKPAPEWVYSYAVTGTPEEFHNKVVTDIDAWEMPLILATAPHLTGAGIYHLSSWPNVAPGAHHWIVIRGYDGLWGSANPVIRYQDSAGRYGGATGAFQDLSAVVWQVNEWNQGGHIIW